MTKVNTLYILILVMKTKAKVQKWGNSHGVRIPISYLNDLGLKDNDNVDITLEANQIVIKKAHVKTFDEIVEGYDGSYVCEEYEPYDIKGNELW